MRHHCHKSTPRTILLAVAGWLALPALWPPAPNALAAQPSAAADSQEAARRQILDSDRWRRTQRALSEWLGVQQIYSHQEVAAIRAQLAAQVEKMSPRELQDLLEVMEERLAALTSPEAEEARHWLAQFLAVAKNPQQQLGRARPDVMNMTASQIRQELLWLQQHRAARQQAQAAFDRKTSLHTQAARDVQTARRQASERAQDRSNWPAHDPQRSQYAPRPERPFSEPHYRVGPWGHPIRWHPLGPW